MEEHPGPGLILADTETKVKKYDALVQTRENQVQSITLMYGYDARFKVAVQGVTSLDERSLATWMEDGKDYEVPTFPLDIVKSELLAETMRNLVETLSLSLVMKIIAQPVSGLKPTYRILESVPEHCKYGIVKKALDCLIAYRLATSPVVSDGTSPLFDSGHGRVDSETSRLHGKTAVSPLISTKLRLVLLRVWQQKRTELLEELSQYRMIQKWLVMLILLLNLEDVEFDCKYRDLKVVEVEEASARVKKHIQTFLVEIGFNSKSLDIGMNDVDGKVVGNILNYNKEMILATKTKDLASAFDPDDLNSVEGMHTSTLLRESLNTLAGCWSSIGVSGVFPNWRRLLFFGLIVSRVILYWVTV